jgi:hypothetical protein
VFHTNTVVFAAALDSGRVFLKHDDWLALNDFCGDDTTLDSCYFHPLSSCKLSREEIAKAPHATAGSNLTDLASVRVLSVRSMSLIDDMRTTVPKQFHEMLSKTGIPQRSWHYWWRSQGVAYIIRPNARIQAEMARRKARCTAVPLS